MKHDLLINERKIIVSATIEGIGDSVDFNFILDTGASKTVISENTAVRLGYELYGLQKGDRLMTAGGGIHSKVMNLPKFSLFGKDIVNFEVSVIEFPMQITYYADGVLGMDFLLQFKNVTFDFDKKTIETS
ncbi:MAG: retroviral-like aspartic protease family protein [Bacteroidales bacterium]|nr:retroviral-like aspartic protease family protein [Bacteroidales bacterium]